MATILDNGICEHNRPVLTQETDQLVSDHDSRHKASLPTSSMVWCASVTTLSNKGFEGNGPCSGMCGTLLCGDSRRHIGPNLYRHIGG
ncbi:uncharacterized protein [Dermacentor andersoni]|uniref:uncharacterized protein isoform X3 n=1 Tax=Dermacentor andersoni TaxID=34620 RepID=UPI002416C86E|nr:uncharacterized protein LOC126541908 isoform X2 [Dermacentor andersoni]